MATTKSETTSDLEARTVTVPVASNVVSLSSEAGAASDPPKPVEKPSHDGSNKAPTFCPPPAYLIDALDDAERLLRYAAETGTSIGDNIRGPILEARAAGDNGWTDETATNLLVAATNLTALVKPVTARSLKCSESARSTIRAYLWVAVALALIIGPFSVLSFLASGISSVTRTDITTANGLAVKLRAELGPPASGTTTSATPSDQGTASPSPTPLPQGLNANDVITDLQLFASTTRSIDARARQLNWLILNAVRDPFREIREDLKSLHAKFQLPVGLPDLAAAASNQTTVYQDVRYFAQNLLDDISFYYGAFTTCVLPVLYALLGTCAYLLRAFEERMSNRTFIPSNSNLARFLMAGIGGAVVGLFNNFTVTQSASIPPLAIAFLVGYAVEAFFAFLEGLLQTLIKSTAGTQTPTAPATAPTA
jgi:hypothetical protein